MKKRDIGSGLVCFGRGAVISFYAVSYGLGGAGTPGPGFLPFLTGLALVVLSLSQVISIWRKEKPESHGKTEKFFPEAGSGRRIFLFLFAAFGYAVVLEHLGFVLS